MYMHTYVQAYIHTHTYTYLHTHAHMHTYSTYMHTYICTYIFSLRLTVVSHPAKESRINMLILLKISVNTANYCIQLRRYYICIIIRVNLWCCDNYS